MENNTYGLNGLLKADERAIGEGVESIEHLIAEMERIKQRNIITSVSLLAYNFRFV